MAKRAAEEDRQNGVSLTPQKNGARVDESNAPTREDTEMGEFEDDFEDEFESEDEIFEAGVDGRPDAEREAEERGNDIDGVACTMC